jgi:hypothetical protein
VDSESDSAPTEAALKQFEKVKAEVDLYMQRWSAIQQADLPALRQSIKPLTVQ